MTTLYEPFAGSAAMTLHFLGSPRALLPYQGSKWRHRRALATILDPGGVGFERYVLRDTGPWGTVWKTLPWALGDVANDVALLSEAEDHEWLWHRLVAAPVPTDPVVFTVVYLILQRIGAGGKAVTVRPDGRWRTAGISKTSAHGTAATDRFGAVRPQLLGLVQRLRELEKVNLQAIVPGVTIGRDTVVYADPPYAGTMGYPDQPPVDVVSSALRWAETGARVVVSEATPVGPLVDRGWRAVKVAESRTPKPGSFNSRQTCKATGAEWVTCSPVRCA